MIKNDKKHLTKFIWTLFILVGIITGYFIWINGVSKTVGTKAQPNKVQINQPQEGPNCSSDKFMILLDRARSKTETADFEEAMELYREAYCICPSKDIEEQMAWLLSQIPNH